MTIPLPDDRSTAVVTGASSGIGAALASQLAERGHHVTVIARRAERLEELATKLRAEQGVGVDVQACDLADAEAREDLLDRLAAGGRRVSVLVNNAGFATGGDFSTTDEHR